MPVLAIPSNVALFDRVAKKVPPILIAISAATAAFEAAPLLSTYLHSEPAPIVSEAAPEPITAPAAEFNPAPRIHVTVHRTQHRVVKHVHHRQKTKNFEGARSHEPRRAEPQVTDEASVTAFVRPGRALPLTSSDLLLRLFRSFGHGG